MMNELERLEEERRSILGRVNRLHSEYVEGRGPKGRERFSMGPVRAPGMTGQQVFAGSRAFGGRADATLSNDLRGERFMVGRTREDKQAAYQGERDYGRGVMESSRRMRHESDMAGRALDQTQETLARRFMHESMLQTQKDDAELERIKAEQAMMGRVTPLEADGQTLGYQVGTGNGNSTVIHPQVDPAQAMGEPMVRDGFFWNGSKWEQLRQPGQDSVGGITRMALVEERTKKTKELDEHEAALASGDKRGGFLGISTSRAKKVNRLRAELAGIDAVLGGGAAPAGGAAAGNEAASAPALPADVQALIDAARKAGSKTFVYGGKTYKVPGV